MFDVADALLRRFGWPSAISMLAIGVWLVAAGADWRWATVALIAMAALALIVPLASAGHDVSSRDELLVVTRLALLASWLTIATGLNAITVFTAQGLVSAATASWWAIGDSAASSIVALFVFLRARSFAYPIPIIWGLIAVFVAERFDRPEAAWVALACAALLTTIWLWRECAKIGARHAGAFVTNRRSAGRVLASSTNGSKIRRLHNRRLSASPSVGEGRNRRAGASIAAIAGINDRRS